MATAVVQTEEQKRERSKAIAARDNLFATHETTVYDEQDRNGVRVYSVPSRTTPNRRYTVRYELATMQARCECLGAQHGLACGHLGAVYFDVEMYEASVLTWLQATGRA